MKYGKDYGVKLLRPFIVSLLANLPIINLFYTRKISIEPTGFDERGGPMFGTSRAFRIFFGQRKLRVKWALTDPCFEVKVRLVPNNLLLDIEVISETPNKNISTHVWYLSEITFKYRRYL